MTAPTLNVNFAAAPGVGPAVAGAVANGKAGKAAGGVQGAFESVLAGLFAEGAGPEAPAVPGARAVKAGKEIAADAPAALAATAEVVAPEAVAVDGEPAPEGDLALTDTLLDAPVTAAPAATTDTTQPPTPSTDTPEGETAIAHAYGRDKPKGSPAAPALEHANPNARLAEKTGLETDQQAPPSEPPTTPTPATVASAPADKALKAQGAPVLARTTAAAAAEPVVTPAAAATTDAEIPVDVAAPVVTEAAAETTAAAAAPAVAVAAKTAAPAPARGPVRAERAKDAIEAPALGRRAVEAARADTPADPAGPAAASADAETVEVAARAPQHADHDAPDSATAQPDAPLQTSGPAPTHAAHTNAVRGAPETVANLAAQIVKKLEAQTTRFDLELNPAGLGKVDVRLEIGAAGQLSAAMTFDNPGAAAEIRARANELQRALEQAGFNLSGGLSFDVARDQGQHRGWDQANDHPNHGHRGRAFQDALSTASDAVDHAVSGALRLRRGLTSALDVRI